MRYLAANLVPLLILFLASSSRAAKLEAVDQSFTLRVPGKWVVVKTADRDVVLLAKKARSEIRVRALVQRLSEEQMRSKLEEELKKRKTAGGEDDKVLSESSASGGPLAYIRFSSKGKQFRSGYFIHDGDSYAFLAAELSETDFQAMVKSVTLGGGAEPDEAAQADSGGGESGGPACDEVDRLLLGDSCATSKGVAVKRVRHGKLEGAEFGGVFWFTSVHQASSNEATASSADKVCKAKDPGLRLPTKQEYESLDASFERADLAYHDGIQEFLTAIPDQERQAYTRYWSSTPDAGDPAHKAWSYRPVQIETFRSDARSSSLDFFCVGKPGEIVQAKPSDDEFAECAHSFRNDLHLDDEKAQQRCRLPHWAAYKACLESRPGQDDDCVEEAAHPMKDPKSKVVFEASCRAGNAAGCRWLGQLYQKENNMAEAMRLYKKGCDAGFQPSCDSLAEIEQAQ
ncbi:MAG: hypothetical protein HY077_10050 [Elusimicrobia bacterium]|nr:hypothetical protein [Elusimicrobiota bacterium]